MQEGETIIDTHLNIKGTVIEVTGGALLIEFDGDEYWISMETINNTNRYIGRQLYLYDKGVNAYGS